MRTLEKIRAEMGEIIAEQTALLDKADAEKRGLTAEEEKRYGEWQADFEDLEAERAYLQRNPDVSAMMSRSQREPTRPIPDGQQMLSASEETDLMAKIGRNIPNRRSNPSGVIEMS